MIIDDRKIIFTRHAIDRLKESQLTLEQGLEVFSNATPYKIPYKDLRQYKASKYTTPAKYFINGNILFTGVDKVDKFTGDPVFLIISVFDNRLYAKRL